LPTPAARSASGSGPASGAPDRPLGPQNIALGDAFRRLHTEPVIPALARGLSATVYTQLSDVEHELNGLLT
jgi:hypothetical protein